MSEMLYRWDADVAAAINKVRAEDNLGDLPFVDLLLTKALVPVDGPAYTRHCDSVVHQAEGEWLEDDTQKEGAAEPITNNCLVWHPELVWYEQIGGDDAAE